MRPDCITRTIALPLKYILDAFRCAFAISENRINPTANFTIRSSGPVRYMCTLGSCIARIGRNVELSFATLFDRSGYPSLTKPATESTGVRDVEERGYTYQRNKLIIRVSQSLFLVYSAVRTTPGSTCTNDTAGASLASFSKVRVTIDDT
jgi:hypothetical protein